MVASRCASPAGRWCRRIEQVTDEIDHVLDALAGRYVPPGPPGAPTRGMAHILPTGRNFYAVDPRAVPSQAAWRVGQQLARELLARHLAEEQRYPEMIGIGAWGTSQMRTQGDDIAEVLALLGVEPVWDPQSRRIQDLARRAAGAAGPPAHRRHAAHQRVLPRRLPASHRAGRSRRRDGGRARRAGRSRTTRASTTWLELAKPTDAALDEVEARARYQNLRREARHVWRRHPAADRDAPLADRSGLRHGLRRVGRLRLRPRRATASTRATSSSIGCRPIEVAVHNQDNREHDIFDSDDYYQFHGGMIASVRSLTGAKFSAGSNRFCEWDKFLRLLEACNGDRTPSF